MPTPTTFEEYLATVPEDRRNRVEELRRTIRAAAPQATETIAYGMPAFRVGRHFLVSFAAFKRHYGLFPASDVVVEALGDQIRPYLAGRGTIQFPEKEPIPEALVTSVVKIRLDEVAGRAP
jgi:uncharacterized protein YdhG (YjbR/CyaY superfamily)